MGRFSSWRGLARRAAPALSCLAILLAAAPAGGREVVVEARGQAAIAPPTVGFEMRDARGKALAPAETGLEDLLGAIAPMAVLDTGASSFVLSGPTAERYGVAPEPGATYVEVGLAGEHPMAVSRAYGLALFDVTTGARRRDDALVLAAQRLLLNESPADLTALLTAPGTGIDVLGMPAIRETTIVIEPVGTVPGGLRVDPRPDGARTTAELWIPLELVDLNRRRHPKNRGALPSLASNPLVAEVRAVVDDDAVRGDWLLDTGSVVTLISTAHARTLGLVDARGKPLREPDFTLPIGGISGAQQMLPGFRIARLEVPAERGVTLVFEEPAVLVHDVGTTLDDGTAVTLDGVFGMNLLLAAGSDPTLVGFAAEYAMPFARIVIDGRRGRLGLTPR
jgi:hypothetical protein